MLQLLIVDDDVTFTLILKNYLEKHHFACKTAHTIKTALKLLETDTFHLCLLDYRLPDGTGLDILDFLNTHNRSIPAIIMTSFNDVKTAVKAMRSGAYDYITKPVNQDELLMLTQQAIRNPATSTPVSSAVLPTFIEGSSAQYLKIKEQVNLIAPTEMSAIIQGESGTGKEYIARLIHTLSGRNGNPFIAIDCGTLTNDLAGSELFGHAKGAFTGAVDNKKGKLEEANGGTLFLDEIGNLGYDVQIKLLRVIQERVIQPIGINKEVKIDVRIIAASNDDLWMNVQQGKFREDLYHRLNEFKIRVPSLRERGTDIDLFINFFIQESNLILQRNVEAVSPEVHKILTAYDWPGNIRELKNIIKRMVLLTKGTVAEVESLPEEMMLMIENDDEAASDTDLKLLTEVTEKETIEKALLQARFNKTKAAKLLNIDRSTLYAKIEKYGIAH